MNYQLRVIRIRHNEHSTMQRAHFFQVRLLFTHGFSTNLNQEGKFLQQLAWCRVRSASQSHVFPFYQKEKNVPNYRTEVMTDVHFPIFY